MIDTHCHLTYDGLREQMDAVVARARAAGVDRMVTVGTTPEDAAAAVAAAGRHAGVHAAVGLHPHYADAWTDRSAVLACLRQLAARPGVVALGEMGLDVHYPEPPLDRQRQALSWQLELAAETALAGLPIIIHNREATAAALDLLRDAGLPGSRFVFHCFTGGPDELERILAFGALVGFTGIVTFRNAAALADCARRVPLDRLLIETDAPFLTPEPKRKVRPNEPCHVPLVAEFLATARGCPLDDFVAAVDANAERFFGLGEG